MNAIPTSLAGLLIITDGVKLRQNIAWWLGASFSRQRTAYILFILFIHPLFSFFHLWFRSLATLTYFIMQNHEFSVTYYWNMYKTDNWNRHKLFWWHLQYWMKHQSSVEYHARIRMYFRKEAIVTYVSTCENKIMNSGIVTRTYDAFVPWKKKEINTCINIWAAIIRNKIGVKDKWSMGVHQICPCVELSTLRWKRTGEWRYSSTHF